MILSGYARQMISITLEMKRTSRVAVFLFLCFPFACSGGNISSNVSTKLPDKRCSNTIGDFDGQYSKQVKYVTADPDLNRLQDFFRPVLEANQKDFAGQLGRIKGFGAGNTYPQIWLRDSATLMPLTRYHYSLDYLTSWLEEHLTYQGEDGQLYDWIASGEPTRYVGAAPKVREVARFTDAGDAAKTIQISADKNTTEGDQETSAVAAAYQIFKITGDLQWLGKEIKGRSLVERLNHSVQYLLKNSFDKEHGLIKNAFTADWGDVSTAYADQRALYSDGKTPSAVGLYTNAMFFNAALQLAELNAAMSNQTMASYWKVKAATAKQNINQHLWQEEKGFYRIHLVLTPQLLPKRLDDSNIFAMGGNALAVLYHIADERQTKRILDVTSQRKREYGVSTIAGVLLPSYPQGFFKHPGLYEEYVYQNGGQWDWFAGRLLLAEFERGHAQRAYADAIEIAKKAVKNNGLFEWHDRSGQGKGSPNYAGSAGVLGLAIFQGLFGVYLDEANLVLRIRLGDQPGQIQLYQPASGQYISYRYCYDQESGRTTLEYVSNFPKAGRIHILLPRNRRPASLSLDGKPLSFETENIGDDTYVVLKTDWAPHFLQLTLTN
jgi:hypothetical protein